MYRADWLPEAIRGFGRRRSGPVPLAVWLLGITSLFIDLSAEMVASVLPFYLVRQLQMGTLVFGSLDGLQQLVRLAAMGGGGWFADRTRQFKSTAVAGYVLSLLSRLGWCVLSPAVTAVGALIGVENIGKGFRTPARDALIANYAPDGAA